LRNLAINYNDPLSRSIYRLLGHVFLVETLRLFKKYGIDQLLASMDRNGIDHVVIHSLEPLTLTQNIVKLLEPHRDRFSLFASVHKNEADPVAYFKTLVEAGGIAGLKIHPQVGGFACGELYNKTKGLVEYAGSANLPILIHTGHIPTGGLKGLSGCSDVRALEPLIADFPQAKIVLAHIGWESWRQVLELAQLYPNVLVETSWQPARIIRRAVDAIGPSRVLFGSDFPLFQQSIAYEQVTQALTVTEFVQVCSVNAKRLLNLEEKSKQKLVTR
jgi:predicted TIM-barrel fold metal-dependent hydrolase